jgi:hypothetical protein
MSPTRNRRLPALLLLAALVLLAAGCQGGRFDRQLTVHSELLATMAADAAASLEQRVGMPEILGLRYPLARARGLAARGTERYPGRPSLAAFEALVADYALLVEHLERTRALAGSGDAVDRQSIDEARRLARQVAEGRGDLLVLLGGEGR